ncbi:hypothetical protein PDE01_07350 [Paracoccus denitrificans]|nr:hypothetical protein PDE01_07350 [Paracoccus denitrificans]
MDAKAPRRGKFELPAIPTLMAEKSDEIKTEKQKPADLLVGRQVGRVSYGTEWLPRGPGVLRKRKG